MRPNLSISLCGISDLLLARSRRFTLFDWAILKTCLISFGLLLGAAFSRFFKKLVPVLAIVFLASWAYALWRLFYDD